MPYPSGPNVLAGLDMDDDISPNALSLVYERVRFRDTAKSLACCRVSSQSSAVGRGGSREEGGLTSSKV